MGDESSSDFVGLNHDEDDSTEAKEHIPALITPDHTVTVGRRKMVLVDSQPIAVDESASKQAEKSTVTWRLVVDGVPKTVTVVHSQLGGKRQVFADGVLVHESRRFFDIGSSHEFDVLNKGKPTRKFLVKIYWKNDANPPGYAYSLSIDGRGVANAENVAVEETKGLTSPLSENDIREAEALKAKEAADAAAHTDATEAPPLPGAAAAKVEADHTISAVAAAPPPSAPPSVPGRRKSVVVDETPVEVTESATRQRQKNIVTWKLSVDGTPRTISVKHNQLSGKRQVFLDQAMLHESRKFFDTGSHHEFDVTADGKPNRKFAVDIVWSGHHGVYCFNYKLSIDGKPLSDAAGVTVEDAKGVSVLPSENELKEAAAQSEQADATGDQEASAPTASADPAAPSSAPADAASEPLPPADGAAAAAPAE